MQLIAIDKAIVIIIEVCFTCCVLCLAMCAPANVVEQVKNENRARTFDDFDRYYPNGRYKLEFKIGDKYELRKSMFLHRSASGIILLEEPDSSSVPSIAEYRSNPQKYEFGGDNVYQIIRLIPKGTVVQLVSIKESDQAGFLTYFVIFGEEDWFRCAFFREWDYQLGGRMPDGRSIHPYTYARQYFRKL